MNFEIEGWLSKVIVALAFFGGIELAIKIVHLFQVQ